MKKRISSLILVFSILSTLIVSLPIMANAATSGIYTYTVSDGKATIIGCDVSANGAIVIPSTLGGCPVTSIGEYAFSWCTGLTSITIPDSVISIGEGAFIGCTGLTSITMGNGVTSIGDFAFEYCIGLTSITIPDSVTSIGYRAFFECTSLTSITIPDSVTSIGSYTFCECGGLTSITIPDSVTSIGLGAFYWCIGLTSITIPDSVTSIGYEAFARCSGLTSVTIPDSVTSIDRGAFLYCTGLTDVYYGGSEEEWNKISIESGNYDLTNATIHYNSTLADDMVLSETTISALPYTCQSLLVYKADGKTAYTKFKVESSDKDVVTTSKDGNEIILNCKAIGTSSIVVSATDGSGDYKICNVVVNDKVTEEERYLLERLALDQIVYSKTLSSKLEDSAIYNQKSNKNSTMFYLSNLEIGWDVFYKQYINDYKVIMLPEDVFPGGPEMGFYAAAFESPDGEIIIAYRGSEGSGFLGVFKFLQDKEKQKKNIDWWGTNLGMFTGLGLSLQFSQALDFYDAVKYANQGKKITLTGHSLGGALASYVAINRDVRCDNVNGATGWLFNNQIFCDPNNYLVDFVGFDQNVFEHFNDHNDFKNKPVTRFANLNTFNYVMYEDSRDYNILSKKELINDDIVFIPEKDYHKISSIINYDYGQIAPTEIKRRYNINSGFVDVGGNNYIGTSKSENIVKSATKRVRFPGMVTSYIVPAPCYAIGGAGNDSISFTSGGEDILIGNAGNDTLNGGAGDDIYVYGGNFGNDTIIDPSGKDKIIFTDCSLSDLTISGSKITLGTNSIEISNKSKRREKVTVVDKNNDIVYISFQNTSLFSLQNQSEADTTKGIHVFGNATVEIYDAGEELIEILTINEETEETIEYKDYAMVAFSPQAVGLTLPPDGYIIKVKSDETVSVWTVSDADNPTLARQTFIENQDLSDGSQIVINTGEMAEEQLSVKLVTDSVEESIYSEVPDNFTITADKTEIKTGEPIIMSVPGMFAESVVWESTNNNVIISKNEDLSVSVIGYTTGEETVRAYLPNDELYSAEFSFEISEDSAPIVVVSSKEEIYDGTEIATDSVLFDVSMVDGYDTIVFDTFSPYSQVEDTNIFVVNSVGDHFINIYCEDSETGARTKPFSFEFSQDSEPPVISGVESGGVYYIDRVIEVSDTSLNTIYINDELCEEETFILSDVGTHTISATDAAGNNTSVTFEIKAIPNVEEVSLKDAETVAQVRNNFEEVKYSLEEARRNKFEEEISKLEELMYTLVEITGFSVETKENGELINVAIENAPEDANVYVASYNRLGKMLEIKRLTLDGKNASETFGTTDVYNYKAFVWNKHLQPLAESKDYIRGGNQ